MNGKIVLFCSLSFTVAEHVICILEAKIDLKPV